MGRRVSSGARSDFAELLRPHHQYLARFCVHLARSEEDGQDLYQQAIMKALEKMDSLRKPGSFRQWLCSIIVNEHRSQCRKESLRRLVGLSARHNENQYGHQHAESPRDRQDAEQTARLRWCLGKLSAKKREAVVLFEVQGFTVAEIAEIQRSSPSAVKTRLSRARRELRRLFIGAARNPVHGPHSKEQAHEFRVRLEAEE